ncbi:hypothetical protein [uncultured Fusobacterium sp.]|uniref:hypothetical protein n=1 Tax=uncultured Fusobacterium sp. TaxID=159267 RepID=UPI0025DA4265|nr:hypothetical protein [uncultured Fusobacterium sp.]
MEEKREAKIIFHKAGNGKSAKLTVPIPWLRELGISEEKREVEISISSEKQEIIIKKK